MWKLLTSLNVNTCKEGNFSLLLIFLSVRKLLAGLSPTLREAAGFFFLLWELEGRDSEGKMHILSTYCSTKPMRLNVLAAFRRIKVWWNVREFHIYFEKCLEGAQPHGTLWRDDTFCYRLLPQKLLNPRHHHLLSATPMQDSFVEMLTIISYVHTWPGEVIGFLSFCLCLLCLCVLDAL